MNELALFAGAGGGILGGHLLGWRTVCAVEWEPYPACVLAARQNDGILPPFPVWDDVQTFDGRPWRGIAQVVSGGFPCQDISAAGKGAGIDGERSGMWKHMARIVGEVLPRFVFVENSPLLVGRGLAVVLGDLAALGYDAQWAVVSASDVGAPHQRERVWIVADASGRRFVQPGDGQMELAWRAEAVCTGVMSDAMLKGLPQRKGKETDGPWKDSRNVAVRSTGWPIEPSVGRVANGVAARVDRLKAIGNGQVPRVAATAFNILIGES